MYVNASTDLLNDGQNVFFDFFSQKVSLDKNILSFKRSKLLQTPSFPINNTK